MKKPDLRGWAERLRAALRSYDVTHNFTCDLCDREVFANERVCASCRESLPKNDGIVCPFCGRKVREPGTCLECKQKPLAVAKARSVLLHEGRAAQLVHQFKNGAKYLAYTCAELALPLVQEEFPMADCITCVPMTKRARRRRGYNQSELFARALAERSGLPFIQPVDKPRDTQEQKTLSRREREKNLRGCFHVHDRKGVRDRNILIADDTLTTGATGSELATVLLRAGAQNVYLITITSVARKNPFGKPPAPDKRK